MLIYMILGQSKIMYQTLEEIMKIKKCLQKI